MDFDKNVFINCPLDEQYHTLLRPMIFTLIYLGLNPRIAIMYKDCGHERLRKIENLMKESKFSIHDLSRMQSTKVKEVFRMNMPFELGLDYGFKCSKSSKQLTRKVFLILEPKRYSYKKAISDISGWDIECHKNDCATLVKLLRDWFVENEATDFIGSYTEIWVQYNYAVNAVWTYMGKKGNVGQACNRMPINEYVRFITKWITTSKQL